MFVSPEKKQFYEEMKEIRAERRCERITNEYAGNSDGGFS